MEFVLEILLEVYMELMMLVVPEEKATSKKYRFLTILIAFLVMMGMLALFIWGCVLVFDRKNWFGLVPMLIAVILSVAQIVLGIVLTVRNER